MCNWPGVNLCQKYWILVDATTRYVFLQLDLNRLKTYLLNEPQNIILNTWAQQYFSKARDLHQLRSCHLTAGFFASPAMVASNFTYLGSLLSWLVYWLPTSYGAYKLHYTSNTYLGSLLSWLVYWLPTGYGAYKLHYKKLEQFTSCVTKYMVSYFVWNINKELITFYETTYKV
jgi:hypothetical protein